MEVVLLREVHGVTYIFKLKDRRDVWLKRKTEVDAIPDHIHLNVDYGLASIARPEPDAARPPVTARPKDAPSDGKPAYTPPRPESKTPLPRL